MKNIYCIALALAGSLLFGSCKKSTDEPKTPEVPKVTQKYLSRIIHTVGTATDFTDFTYDTKNRLSTAKYGANTTVVYTYDGDNLFSIDAKTLNGTGTARNYYEFAYQNNVLKSGIRKIYANDVLSRDYMFDFTVVNGQVTQTIPNSGPSTVNTYSDGNLATTSTGGSTISYTYDSQKSIFTNALAKYFTPGENSDRFSKNNVTKSVNNGTTVNYTYTYDSDGFPLTLVAGQDKYTYQYVNL